MRAWLFNRDRADPVEVMRIPLVTDDDVTAALTTLGSPTTRVGDVTRPWWSLPTIPDYDRPATETEEI